MDLCWTSDLMLLITNARFSVFQYISLSSKIVDAFWENYTFVLCSREWGEYYRRTSPLSSALAQNQSH